MTRKSLPRRTVLKGLGITLGLPLLDSMVPAFGQSSAKPIHRFVGTLADNGVDTFLINANASTAWYPTKAVPSILDGYKRGDREFFRGHALQGNPSPEEVEKRIDLDMAELNRLASMAVGDRYPPAMAKTAER